VDDGSSDGTEELLKDIKTKHDNFVYFKQDNKGMFPAWNTGVALACGQIIVFTDSDCFAPDNFLESIVKHFENYPDMAACTWSTIPVFRNKLFAPLSKYYKSVHERGDGNDRVFSGLNPFMVFSSDSTAIRKDIFLSIGGFSSDQKFMRSGGGVGADSALGLKLLAAGYTIRSTDKIHIYHYQRNAIKKLIIRHYAFGWIAAANFKTYFEGYSVISLPFDKHICRSNTPFTFFLRFDTFKILSTIIILLLFSHEIGAILLVLYFIGSCRTMKMLGGSFVGCLSYKLYRYLISASSFFGYVSGSIQNGVIYL